MAFLTELGTRLKSHFAKINHNHDSTYEAKNVNIQNHITATGNPHGTTKADIGLSNVTNHAQMKKSASSIIGNVPVYANANGDALNGGYGVETTFVGGSDKLALASAIKSYVDNQTLGISGGIVPGGTQTIATLKIIDVTDNQIYPDKILINVEDTGLFRLDRESSATSDDVQIVEPTTGVGRWLKMSSHISSHNNTDNKQGGTADEYYHITAAQHSALPAGITSANKLVAENNAKLAKLRNDGTLSQGDIYVTSAEWTAFDNTLNS